jgi:hypothetical protein
MEIPSIGSQAGLVSSVQSQPIQPQEQQARNLRSERERGDSSKANDQVTLSGASRQIAAQEDKRVTSQTEASAATDKSQNQDRVEQAKQTQIDNQKSEQSVPRSVARALDTYSQTAVL